MTGIGAWDGSDTRSGDALPVGPVRSRFRIAEVGIVSANTDLLRSESGAGPEVVACLLLSALWLIPLGFIGIEGNFPVNDDWAYARATQRLIETGLIERTSWTWVPLITHAYFGAATNLLVVPPLGMFEAFRLVGVVGGWLGMLGAYALCRQVGALPVPSVIGAALVGLNPVYVSLAYTYMTDVPFTALCAWSLVFLARGARRGSTGWVVAAAIPALLAALTRQTAMALPLAFAAATVFSQPWPGRAWGRALLLGAIVGSGYFAALQFAYGPEDSGTLFQVGDMARESYPIFHLVRNSVTDLSYLGCFLIAVILLPGTSGLLRPRWVACFAALFAAAGIAIVIYFGLPMPPGINVIYNLGVGLHEIHGHKTLAVPSPGAWWVLTALGFAAAWVAGVRLAVGAGSRIREVWKRPDWLLLLAFSAIFLFPHLLRSPTFDRYLLPALAPLAAALLVVPSWSGRPSRQAVVAGMVVLAIFAAYGTIGTRDYFTRKRAQFGLLDEITATGVSPRRIDGGFEFNGLHSFERRVLPDDIIWGYVNDDEFMLSHFEELDGYRVVASKSYPRIMPPRTETLRLFHRDPPAPGGKGE